MTILVIAEHDNNVIKSATLNTVTAAGQLGSDITVLLAGHNSNAAASSAATITGVTKVIHVDDAQYEHVLAEEIAPLVVSLAADATHILAPASTFGKNIIPRIAALLDVAAITDISKIESNDTFVRPIYAGNAMATVQSSDNIKVMTIRTTAFDAAENEGGSASIEANTAIAASGLSSFVKQELTKSERPELTSAGIIISGGRGFGSEENFALLNEVADKLGAAIGASRAAVDAGFAPNDYQVGQTGKIVAPDLYIAVGISGAIQHLAGMKDSKVIVAVNKDEEAPIFEVADYGLVADLFQVLPELSTALDNLS
jgi:electron transfer flavoprotein alpha subunit